VLIVAGISIYIRDYHATMEKTVRQYQSAVQQADASVDYLIQDIADISVYFCINPDILKILTSVSSETQDPLFWMNQTSMQFIRDNLAIKSYIRTLILYPENELPPFYISHDASVHYPSIDRIRGLDMYAGAVKALGDLVLVRVDAGTGDEGLFLRNTKDKIVVCREIFDLSKQRRLGFLAMSIDVSWIEGIFKTTLIQDNEALVMRSADKHILVKTGEAGEQLLAYIMTEVPDQTIVAALNVASTFAVTSVGSSENSRRGEEWYIFQSSQNGSQRVYYLSPKHNWDAWIRRGLTLPVLLGLALLISSWPLSALASRIISRPLDRLYQSMNRFKEGDFKTQVAVEGNDEIAGLSKTFNLMVAEIKELIDRNYVIVLREKESEMNALQAQINPHFLYNVLDSLYWQAIDSSQGKLAEDILALSGFFRLSLSSGLSDIPVEQEVRIISTYLHIQKMRFSKKLDYHITVDSDILSYTIPKLILQPFVENAVVHGLECTDCCGLVTITGKREKGRLLFLITDNGVGVDEAKIQAILFGQAEPGADQRGKYSAIRNIKERMTLRYGEKGILEIKRRPETGTEVRIVIPV
jgi:two-component system sensor histidine kinase YesM